MKTTLLPNHILEKMSVSDRRAIKQTTAAEAGAKYNLRLEREDQRQFTQWLNSREIYYLWSRTDKAVTIQVGHPDITIFHKGLVLFIEFKRPGKKLSGQQEETKTRLEHQHFDYRVCYSVEEAITETRRFFSI